MLRGILCLIFIFRSIFINLLYYLIVINLFGISILRLICLFQFDIKLIIAISSVIHIGIISIGILRGVKVGLLGGLLIIISHGFVSSGLFYLVNIIYIQINNRIIFINKGIVENDNVSLRHPCYARPPCANALATKKKTVTRRLF